MAKGAKRPSLAAASNRETRFRSSHYLSAAVDSPELPIRPLHRILGRHSLRGLGIHVRDQVLAQSFSRLAVGGARISGKTARTRRSLERQHAGAFVPERILLPYRRRADRVALLRVEPFLIDLLRGDPTQKIFCRFLVLRISHEHVGHGQMIAELTGGPLGGGGVGRVL